jgi:hypothetical protein
MRNGVKLVVMHIVAWSVFLCVSCATRGQAYYLDRGEKVKQQIITELRGVGSLQDLFERQESLTVLFDELARLAVEAHRYQLASKTTWDVPSDASVSSQELLCEMRRVLAIPGARAFLEKCQGRGLERLDKNLVH